MSGAALELNGLVKRFGDVEAVRELSMVIEPGEFVTFLGPSGSGKTTTLNMIAGFTEASGGHILMDGTDISSLPPHKRNIGMVFQNYALFPHMTVFENIAFPLRQRKVPKDELKRRVDEVLGLVRLDGYGNRLPRQLSGGQQQRVAVARALVFRPSVLLMDEPLGALDKKLREWLQLELKRIHNEVGLTFVYVTHDQEEALVLSDRIAVFNHGAVEQIGAATDLYERPATRFVAEFLGESNSFVGTLADRNGCASVRVGPTTIHVPDNPTCAVGTNVVAIVRPERMQIADAGAQADEGFNQVAGRVQQVVYLGGLRRYFVEIDGGQVVTILQQAGAPAPAGDAVSVRWPVTASVLLPNSEGLDATDEPVI